MLKNGLNLKKKVVGLSVVAACAVSLNAVEIYNKDGLALELYGQAAVSFYDNSADDKGFNSEVESRIGVRASKELTNGLTAFGQIESGNANNNNGGQFGQRDTFIGVKGDFGSVRFGRLLTPMYQLVDWPYSNPGLGGVFDWGNTTKFHFDRQSDQIRYDGSTGATSYAASIGKASTEKDDAIVFGASVSHKVNDNLSLHAALEKASNRTGANTNEEDSFGYLLGFDTSFGNGFGFAAAYKAGDNKSDIVNKEQGAYSAIARYSSGNFHYKLGYSHALESDHDGVSQNDEKKAISGQAMYVNNGVAFYLRLTDFEDAGTPANDGLTTRIGMEFGF